VSSLNTTDNTFVLKLTPGALAGVTVSFSGATTLDDLPVGGLADNLFVEVKTSSTAAPLVADAIEGRRDLSDEGTGAAHVSVSGFVSGLAGTSPDYTFWVGGQAVQTSAATIIGTTIADGAKVDVEGPIDANGVLQARKVEPEL
jgi:hypothetical protein